MGWGHTWAEEGFPNGKLGRCIESHRLSLRFDFAARMATLQCFSGLFLRPPNSDNFYAFAHIRRLSRIHSNYSYIFINTCATEPGRKCPASIKEKGQNHMKLAEKKIPEIKSRNSS